MSDDLEAHRPRRAAALAAQKKRAKLGLDPEDPADDRDEEYHTLEQVEVPCVRCRCACRVVRALSSNFY